MRLSYFFLSILCISLTLFAADQPITLGVDRFFDEELYHSLKGKNVALLVNHTSVNRDAKSTVDLFIAHDDLYTIKALFTPEHGFDGSFPAGKKVLERKTHLDIPVHSLHSIHVRPTEEMLEGIDVIIYDIQDSGARTYTYGMTLFYTMEAAAKKDIKVIVLDRPNPVGGEIVDGSLIEADDRWNTLCPNVPLCHGMTIGELAQFFNQENEIECSLSVISMKGWDRSMNFEDTGLIWIPTSPQMPEATTPLYYLTTGVLGELSIVNMGVGYTTPFKVVGAPFIDAQEFAQKLNEQNLPGVRFLPFHFRPFFGLYKQEVCHGVYISIDDRHSFRPVSTQYLILGVLKTLYPLVMENALSTLPARKREDFCKAVGSRKIFDILCDEKYVAWKLVDMQQKDPKPFLETRKKYLIY